MQGSDLARASDPVEVSSADILLVGDSLCAFEEWALDAAFSEAGIEVHQECLGGRRLTEGADIIEASFRSYETIIVELGTNTDDRLVMRDAVDRIIAAADGAVVRFVQPYVTTDWNFRLVGLNDYTSEISVQNDDVEVCRWSEVLKSDLDILLPDGVHYTPSGSQVFASYLVDCISGEVAESSPPDVGVRPTRIGLRWYFDDVTTRIGAGAHVENGTEVEWLVDDAVILADSSEPFDLWFESDPYANGEHTLAVRTRDAVTGEWVTTPAVTFVKRDPPPTTTTTIAADHPTTISHGYVDREVATWLWASADVIHGDEVEWLVDGVVVFTDSAAPFAISMDTAQFFNGEHSLVARTRDRATGEWVTTPEATFTKDGPTAPTVSAPTTSITTTSTVPPATVPPTVTTTTTTVPPTTTPLSTTTVPRGATTIRHGWVDREVATWLWGSAIATDVDEVEWLVDGVVVFTDSVAPFAISMDTAQFFNGEHSLVARTRDRATGEWVTTPEATFTKDGPTAPTVSAPTTSITTTSTVPPTTVPSAATATIRHGWVAQEVATWLWASAVVTDAVEVEWLLDGVVVFTDSAAPYAISMEVGDLVAGEYSLVARARDVVTGEWVLTPEATFAKT